jgi:hypothetical protein
MAKHSHPELEGHEPRSLYTFQLKKRGQEVREKTSWALIGLLAGIGLTAGFALVLPNTKLPDWPFVEAPVAADDPFKQGVIHAMEAAELTQSAEFREDWVTVALQWEYALNKMRAVTKEHANYTLAQQKITEYDRNLQYAQSNVTTRPSRSPATQNYWTIGSNRELVVAIQGIPARVVQYPNSCYETWNYGDSIVELENGYVKQYDDFSNNLKVLETGQIAQSMQAIPGHWTLGTTQEDIYQIQGTPSRTSGSTSGSLATLYYGNSSVQLEDGVVVGYLNADGNLKISTEVFRGQPSRPVGKSWSLGATRMEVLAIQQQTPTAVSRNDETCEEIYHFANSEVSFRQGLVSGYRNIDQNLLVH